MPAKKKSCLEDLLNHICFELSCRIVNLQYDSRTQGFLYSLCSLITSKIGLLALSGTFLMANLMTGFPRRVLRFNQCRPVNCVAALTGVMGRDWVLQQVVLGQGICCGPQAKPTQCHHCPHPVALRCKSCHCVVSRSADTLWIRD